MVIDQRDYERISGRRGDPKERLAVAKTQLDERRQNDAEKLHRARMARGLAFAGLGEWALVMLHPRAMALVVIAVIVIAIVVSQT